MQKVIHGDYQTPRPFAHEVVSFVKQRTKFRPSVVIEPTCGEGSFLLEAAEAFPSARVIGFELDASKVEGLLEDAHRPSNVTVTVTNFFTVDWARQMPKDRCLIVGNPPWVAVSRLGELDAVNRPPVTLKLGQVGIDNKTGASNFDIAEFMTLALAKELVHKKRVAIALLLKSTAVRRLAIHLQALARTDVHFYRIDGRRHFGVSVACGLLYVDFTVGANEPSYLEYDSLAAVEPCRSLAIRGRHLESTGQAAPPRILSRQFRSGVKHDAATILELTGAPEAFQNKRGESVDLPEQCVFPFVKSAGLGKPVSKWFVMPPSGLARYAEAGKVPAEPILKYLRKHRDVFDRRKSSVYSKLGEFSVFGVGDYSYQPWKVAISAFSKTPQFHLVGPHEGKPVLFDDTVYFVSFDSEAEARRIQAYLMEPKVQAALQARMFGDDMRAVKAKVLNQLFLR